MAGLMDQIDAGDCLSSPSSSFLARGATLPSVAAAGTAPAPEVSMAAEALAVPAKPPSPRRHFCATPIGGSQQAAPLAQANPSLPSSAMQPPSLTSVMKPPSLAAALASVLGPNATSPTSSMGGSALQGLSFATPTSLTLASPTVGSLMPMPTSGIQQDLWAVDQSFRLGDSLQEPFRIAKAQARLLDRSAVFSVNQAVSALNQGTVKCEEDLCVAFSASSRAFYLLYRRNAREKAIAALDVLLDGPLMTQAGQLLGPRLVAPTPSSGPTFCRPDVRNFLSATDGLAQGVRAAPSSLLSAAAHPALPSTASPSTASAAAAAIAAIAAAGGSTPTAAAAQTPIVAAAAEVDLFANFAVTQQPSIPLAAGAVVQISGCTCHITAPIGMGSFGAVWAGNLQSDASDGELSEVAIKEIICRSQVDLANAAYEGRLLELLMAKNCRSGPLAKKGKDPLDRIPSFVANEIEVTGPESWRVRLAMSKVPGIALDQYLESLQPENGPPSQGPSEQLAQFTKACNFALALVQQIAPVFERLSLLAYHRDINSHNVLVDVGSSLDNCSASPCFGLVDFGLAVDVTQWRGNFGPESWHLVDIGGDCRYWPMSAWLQFECGWQELSKYPPLSSEYQAQLDLHALGITALQALAGICSELVESGETSAPSVDTPGPVLPEVVGLLTAWQKYWKNATRFWQRLLDTFRNGGDQNALKVWCIEEGVHNVIGQDLAALRAALRQAGEACRAGSEDAIPGADTLFSVLLELVSAGGVCGDADESIRPSSWDAVMAIVAPAETKPKGVSSGAARDAGQAPLSAAAADAPKVFTPPTPSLRGPCGACGSQGSVARPARLSAAPSQSSGASSLGAAVALKKRIIPAALATAAPSTSHD